MWQNGFKGNDISNSGHNHDQEGMHREPLSSQALQQILSQQHYLNSNSLYGSQQPAGQANHPSTCERPLPAPIGSGRTSTHAMRNCTSSDFSFSPESDLERGHVRLSRNQASASDHDNPPLDGGAPISPCSEPFLPNMRDLERRVTSHDSGYFSPSRSIGDYTSLTQSTQRQPLRPLSARNNIRATGVPRDSGRSCLSPHVTRGKSTAASMLNECGSYNNTDVEAPTPFNFTSAQFMDSRGIQSDDNSFQPNAMTSDGHLKYTAQGYPPKHLETPERCQPLISIKDTERSARLQRVHAFMIAEKRSRGMENFGQFHPSTQVGGPGAKDKPDLCQGLHCDLLALPAVQVSRNYEGDTTVPGNLSARVSDDQNCSLWILGLPAMVNHHELLSAIRGVGKVFATVINPPTNGHTTSAAKIVFFTRYGAERLTFLINNGCFVVMRKVVSNVRWNKIKSAPHPRPHESRSIKVTGPAYLMDFEYLQDFFQRRFAYELDEFVEYRSYDGRQKTQVWHFGSLRCQAASAKLAIEREMKDILKVEWTADPCE